MSLGVTPSGKTLDAVKNSISSVSNNSYNTGYANGKSAGYSEGYAAGKAAAIITLQYPSSFRRWVGSGTVFSANVSLAKSNGVWVLSVPASYMDGAGCTGGNDTTTTATLN